MSGIAGRRARRLSLVSNGQVIYLGSRTHQCRQCRLTWDPNEVGELCPDCGPPTDGSAA